MSSARALLEFVHASWEEGRMPPPATPQPKAGGGNFDGGSKSMNMKRSAVSSAESGSAPSHAATLWAGVLVVAMLSGIIFLPLASDASLVCAATRVTCSLSPDDGRRSELTVGQAFSFERGCSFDVRSAALLSNCAGSLLTIDDTVPALVTVRATWDSWDGVHALQLFLYFCVARILSFFFHCEKKRYRSDLKQIHLSKCAHSTNMRPRASRTGTPWSSR